ncbi:hypothetical protein JKP88DRAFT_282098 [Tribonema minus]|uniref:Uncharacterized protein n=1 Tax=Tribonema minus TaxID=303371 RepID=A0A835YPE7_9STRA|nr:hypothetical protein JKP88DRAFT_282098 [Tribonema minus]
MVSTAFSTSGSSGGTRDWRIGAGGSSGSGASGPSDTGGNGSSRPGGTALRGTEAMWIALFGARGKLELAPLVITEHALTQRIRVHRAYNEIGRAATGSYSQDHRQMALSDIVGVNAAARRSKYLSGKIKARISTLVPANAGDNVGIAIEKDKRIKSFRVLQRNVGETFAFLESVIESEISWVKSERLSTELLSTNVVNPGTNEKMPLYSTPEPTTQEQEVVFDYTRFADVEAYGLISGKTRLDDGGLFVGTKGQSLVQYDPVLELPSNFATSFGDYRVFFYKDEHWKSGRVVQCELNTGRTASCTLCITVYVEIGKDRRETPVAQPYKETNLRVIHTAYHGSCVLDAGSNGRWFLRKKASTTLPVALPVDRSAAPPPPTAATSSTSRTEEHGLSYVLAHALPGQGVVSLGDAWRKFLLQRAVIVFNGIAIFHDYITDPDRSKKTNKRLDSAKFIKNRILKDKRAALIYEDEAAEVADALDVEEAPDLFDDGDDDDESFSESEEEEGGEEGEVGADSIDGMDGDGMEEEAGEGELGGGYTSIEEGARTELGGGYTSIEEGARTGGIMQAIVDSVTACQLLPPPRFHMYSDSMANTSYGRLSWPGLSWSQVNSFRLMRFTGPNPGTNLTVGGASDIPVNHCLKNLSMAAVIGRLPTCASGCTLLTPREVELVLERCDGRAHQDSPEATWTPLPRAKLRDTLPLSLSALVCVPGQRKGRNVVQDWTLTRAEIVCKAADVGVYENTYTATSINGINCSTLYLFHTAKYLNVLSDKQHLTYYFKSLHGQQVSYQQLWRGKLAEEQSAHVRDNTKMEKGRLISADDGSHVYDEMINVMLRGTWGPFETCITNWLEANGKTAADLDDLSSILQQQAVWGTAKGKPLSGTEAAHLTQVPWVLELAQHLLDDHANLYDCFNLETLAHLIAYMETPVRQQDVWDNRPSLVYAKVINYVVIDNGVKVNKVGTRLFLTIDDPTNKKTAGRMKGRAGHLNDPLPTSIPQPPGLTRMYLVVLFVCRSMRMLWQQSTDLPNMPVPDRIIGLAGNSNKLLRAKTFTEVIRKLGMCHFAIPKWGPYSIRNTFVTEIFREAYSAEGSFGRGAAQELLVGRMNDIHSSLDAAISNYNQWVRAEHTSLLRPSKCRRINNGGRYGGGGSGSAMAGDDINADAGGNSDSLRQGCGGYGGGGDALSVAQVAAEAIQNMQRMHAVSMQQMHATHARSLHHLQTLQSESAQQARQAHQAWLAQQQAQQVMYFHFFHMMQRPARSGFPQLQSGAHALTPYTLPAGVQNAPPGFRYTGPHGHMGFNPSKR